MKTAERETKLEAINKDIDTFVLKTKTLVIKTKEQMTGATEYLANIVARKKRIEVIRISYTQPLNETLRNINADFKKASAPLEEAEGIVKSKMIEYRRVEAERIEIERKKEEERLRKEEEVRIAKEKKKAEREAKVAERKLAKENLSKKKAADAKKIIDDEKKAKQDKLDKQGEEFVPEVDIKQENTVHSESGAARMRKVWKFEIENEKQIPKAYLTVDEVKIRKAIKGGVREIAGVRIYEDEQVGIY